MPEPPHPAGADERGADAPHCRHPFGGGARAFVTAMLDVEVLSGPGTWETTVRGKNRPRENDPAR